MQRPYRPYRVVKKEVRDGFPGAVVVPVILGTYATVEAAERQVEWWRKHRPGEMVEIRERSAPRR